ncbi:MAG: hypothetical protein WC599_11895 [Bacteroidales bacterium]
MKKSFNWLYPLTIVGILLLLAVSCKKSGDSGSNETFGYEFYRGSIPNSYYMYNYMNERALKVTGKPFMVVKYDRLTHDIIDFEFGLDEVTQSAIPGASVSAPPEPTLNASSIDYKDKFNLKSPVDLLVNWPVTAWGDNITNGLLGAGGSFFSYSAYGCKWKFSYLPAGSMTGGVTILDYIGGRETDTESSFNMLKQ